MRRYFADLKIVARSKARNAYLKTVVTPTLDAQRQHGCIAREAGRLGMAVHLHSLKSFGAYYQVFGTNPLPLESAIDDPTLCKTTFVIIHGGGMYASRAATILWKPNAYGSSQRHMSEGCAKLDRESRTRILKGELR